MLDKKYNAKEKEEKWLKYWNDFNIYKFIENEKKVYSIDTPPPTVNGKIHIGHIFSYSQAEMIARYKRLSGYNVFYPFGFDDNGLPSERLVEKEQGKKASEIGREKFRNLCLETTNKYEEEFKILFSRLGMSTDWSLVYKTVSPSTIKISQKSFIDLVNNKNCYHKESPALWCNECLTSIAQAELESKTVKTTFNYLRFSTDDNIDFVVATTRPELLPAIVCVFINPHNEKTNHLKNKMAKIPLLNISVPILEDEKVDINKGSGVVMCCTFGDQTDIEWWKKYKLPLKHIFTENGYIKDEVKNYGGLTIKEARKQILKDLEENNFLEKQEFLEHTVQTHERCGKEVEYAIMKQWFIDTTSKKEEFIKIGKEINWYPSHMANRYFEWVNNIAWDWCISRQRYFGVPFPLWYCKDCGEVILADEESLPVNPLVDKSNKLCPNCNCSLFLPETDVMDTWATSSLTPLINMKYKEKNNYEDMLKPMSLRVNASEIIRTWDFYSIVKSYYHFSNKPWENVMVSGFAMANKTEKISKSKNNSKHEPLDIINNYSADVVRYWAASGRLGTDITFNEETLLRGKKLINKIWNLSKFIEMHLQDYKECEVEYEYLDSWILLKYNNMDKEFKKLLDEYEIGLGLNILEKFFWNFCDDYIEIVKHRLYRPEEFGEEQRRSGQKTVRTILYKLLQNFSIYFPFITEEIFQEIFANEKSIHISEFKDLNVKQDEMLLKNGNVLMNLVSEIRGIKTINNVSLKTVVKTINIDMEDSLINSFNSAKKDLLASLFIEEINFSKLDNDYKIISYLLDK
ncbi:MAG: valine--tRNA ligase [Mycoplasmatota bacterium]